MASANALLLSHLSLLLLLLCTSALAIQNPPAAAPHHPPPPPPAASHHPPPPPPHHHHHHPHPQPHPPTPPPTHPPVKPPASPPVKPPAHAPVPAYPPVTPPAHPPVKPPSHPPASPPRHLPPRKMMAVQGVVYCKPCKYRGISTVHQATPLVGAVVRLQCNNTKYGMKDQATTDKNGYFYFLPKRVTTAAFHKCKVFLVSSPVRNCSVPTNFHSGLAGALLIPSRTLPPKPTPHQFFNVGPFAFEPNNKTCHY